MNWKKTKIIIENGEEVSAQSPIIVSASRSTDIPAFYSDWFMKRLEAGYIKWINPFNGVPLYVSLDNTRLIVFWSKNPEPMLKYLNHLNDKNINYYFQFTLNDYVEEGLEKKVANLDKRIETFIKLSEKIGKEKVIWRFDPYILTRTTDVDELLKRSEYIGNKLINYTNKLVFSFADIGIYQKVKKNLINSAIQFREFNEVNMKEMALGLKELNKKWNFEIATCAEKINLEEYGIKHNKCIDDDLIKKLFKKDYKLMEFLGYELKEPDLFDNSKKLIPLKNHKNVKDNGQREVCGCIMSKDIGQYNTCPHECLYCYANSSVNVAHKNYKLHLENPNSETITGV